MLPIFQVSLPHNEVIKDGFTADNTDIMQSTKTESLTGNIQLSFSASLNPEQTCKMLYITPKNQLLHVLSFFSF